MNQMVQGIAVRAVERRRGQRRHMGRSRSGPEGPQGHVSGVSVRIGHYVATRPKKEPRRSNDGAKDGYGLQPKRLHRQARRGKQAPGPALSHLENGEIAVRELRTLTILDIDQQGGACGAIFARSRAWLLRFDRL